MTLLTASQLASIRSLGEQGMTQTVYIRRYLGLGTTEEGDWGDPTETWETAPGTEVQGWLVSNLGRGFDEDGDRVVGEHDFTLRVPVGTVIGGRDIVAIAGTDYTVVEAGTEDTWPEWTRCYLTKVE